MCANSVGSSETAWMRRHAWAFAGCLCDKYDNLMSWLKYCLTGCKISSQSFSQRNRWGRYLMIIKWTASSEFGTYRLCEQRRFRRACASAQSRQNLRCSLIQAVNQEEPSHRKPDPWPLWIAGHAQLKFVMTKCSKTQIRLTGPKWWFCAVLYKNNGCGYSLKLLQQGDANKF